jgi:hypothetical protein
MWKMFQQKLKSVHGIKIITALLLERWVSSHKLSRQW